MLYAILLAILPPVERLDSFSNAPNIAFFIVEKNNIATFAFAAIQPEYKESISCGLGIFSINPKSKYEIELLVYSDDGKFIATYRKDVAFKKHPREGYHSGRIVMEPEKEPRNHTSKKVTIVATVLIDGERIQPEKLMKLDTVQRHVR